MKYSHVKTVAARYTERLTPTACLSTYWDSGVPVFLGRNIMNSSPVSIQTQSLALVSSQSWLPLLRPSIPIGWRLRLLREIFMLGRSSGNHDWLLASFFICQC